MSGFRALNIESDDESDVEVDDTKELQIEDALKLYQNALKFHSEGPQSFKQAAPAYEELFQSDIFKYPESQTELHRIELYGPLPDTEDLWQDGIHDVGALAPGGLETGSSTLPQILHLSHKNYAQFKLEYLAARMDSLNVSLTQILEEATSALDHFVEALDKDDSDLDLWRRTAIVGDMLDSKRVARFCLEAVLDGDDESLGGVLALPGLEEGLAGEQLRHLVDQLQDRLSVIQGPLSTSKRSVLSKMLRQRLNDYQTITDRQINLRAQEEPKQNHPPTRVVLKAPNSWAGVAEMLLRQLMAEQHGTSLRDPGIAIEFDVSFMDPCAVRAIERAPPLAKSEVETSSPKSSNMPTTLDEQFPGMDSGRPTVQPQIAPAAKDMLEVTGLSADSTVPDSPTITLPTRKRSGDAAGLNDSPEEGRTKSKRTRTRDSTAADEGKQAILDANTLWELEQKLDELQAADDWMFETVGNLFERFGIVGFEAGKNVRQEMQNPTPGGEAQIPNGNDANKTGLQLARSDIHNFLNNYSDSLADAFLKSSEAVEIMQGPNVSGLAGSASNTNNSKALAKPAVLPDDGLLDFLEGINGEWLMTQEVAWRWICQMLRPNSEFEVGTYVNFLWPENLKTMVVRTLVNFDESILDTAQRELDNWKEEPNASASNDGLTEMIEATFELHLDIYCLIKQTNSGVDAETIAAQRHRLRRWSVLAREAMHHRSTKRQVENTQDNLSLRFLWAVTFHLGADLEVSQDHVLDCMYDLRSIFVDASEPVLQLQNNAIMPELSVAALDREISRLTTKDFFLKVTSQEAKDPATIIESLEPLLEALPDENSSTEDSDGNEVAAAASGVPPELIRFLQNSDMSVRLLLWQRLRDAYLTIDYKPMVVTCYFKMTKVLLDEVKATLPAITSQIERQTVILKSLGLIQDMVMKALAIIQSSKENAFECVDETCLRTAVTSFGAVLQLLQVFNVFEDSIRIGKSQPPANSSGLTPGSFETLGSRLHNMQVQLWYILYLLLKEAIFQFHDLFPTPAEDKFDFLKVVHRNLGLRAICGSSNRVFVRLLKEEFFQMTHIEGYDSEQAQVLFDLYGLNCFLNPSYEMMEHNCVHDAFLDRSVALQAVDLLMQQAAKLPMKDLVKHPIKDTIDKVHGAAPRKKPTDAIMRNREIQRAFLRSTINPLDLYNCLKGEGAQLNVSRIPKEDALLASKGWYFLMGHIALTKFRSQKRTGPTPTEDVDIAIAFFMQDLEFSADNWETWFRLAQAYDTKIEESVVWSAEKLNNSMNDIAQLQRAAIHCYIMATALAYRSADLTAETSEKMTELFSDFAMRIFASSREPFNMLPFAYEDEEKFFSMDDTSMRKGRAFQPIGIYTLWKLTKVLLQRALPGRSQSWTLHFTLGKCLWKMHAAPDEVRGQRNTAPSAQEVLSSFIQAIELIPDKKDSREKKEPILEPHYKLVSVVHKMVTRSTISLEQAKEALSNTPYARTATFPEELDEWVPQVLRVLKTLRAADKSNWHHRMVARAAQIIYDDSDPRGEANGPGNNLGAMGAKHELTQQMFTKTMVLQVWRPECERAGRHFVYTSRYTRLFVRILEQLKDRTNLEMLARRVRRRPHDLFEHASVWQDICYAYLRLLRNYGALAEGLETSVFSTIAHEDFLERKEPLEKWMQAQETGASPALDVLREVQELKKINQSLMKPGPIDDLIGDSYAYLFSTIGKQLWEEERRVKQEEEARRPPPIPTPPRNPMMSLTNLMNVDGANDQITAAGQPTQPPQPTQASADQAPTRRKIGVGRREIRTCAESCFQKAAAPSSQASSKPLPRVQVVIHTNRQDASGEASVETSAPGSIHDSADDESELSDLDELDEGDVENSSPPGKLEPKPMFPGLISRLGSREVSEGFETAEEEPVGNEEDVEMNEPLADDENGHKESIA